jgi:DNA-binding NarL/FixJ family response regulator
VSNISKAIFLAQAGTPARNGCSALPELCERYPTISIVVLSGRREAMLGVLQEVFGRR